MYRIVLRLITRRVALGVAVLAPACSLLNPIEGLSDGDRALSDGGRATDAALDVSNDGGVDGDSSVDDGGGDAGCPALRGPAMVRVTSGAVSFCIDSTEVTNADYQAFLADFGAVPENDVPECAWKTTHEAPPFQPAAAKIPRRDVDWCDARAYCKWAGKRLCGKIGGGPASVVEQRDPLQGQWLFACSGAGARIYPYGDTFDSRACAGREFFDGGFDVYPVATFPKCEGGFSKIFDMSGNVREFLDTTEAVDGGDRANDLAYVTSSIFDGELDLSCRRLRSVRRNFAAFDIGIRCCER